MHRQWIITPVYKGKGSVQDCGNYRSIKVMSHTMKLFERIIDMRMRQECTISECQYRISPRHNTIDPVFAFRIVTEKETHHCSYYFWTCKEPLTVFCDVWSEEAYIDTIREMYRDSACPVKTTVVCITPFKVSVKVRTCIRRFCR